MNQKITLCSELERVHLRFLKVPNAAKLSDILAKLLPNILMIYFEPDMENEAMSLDQPKIKAIEEIVNHLMMKVTNSKGEVKMPFCKLIEIFSSDVYLNFANQNIKAHGKNRIFDFIFASYAHLDKNIETDMTVLFIPILKSLLKLDDNSQEKSTLLDIWVHRLIHYFKAKQMPRCLELLKTNLQDNEVLKQELLSCLFNFVVTFQQPETVNQSSQTMVQHITQSMQFMHETFRDKANLLEDTWTNCHANANLVVLRILQDNQNEMFATHESIPLILLMSFNVNGSISGQADSFLKSFYQEFDRNDAKLVSNVFKLMKNENIYKIGLQENQEMVLAENERREMPILTRKHMIDFLIKFDCSASTEEKQNLQLIETCIAQHQDFLSYALKFINHMIKANRDVYLTNQNSQGFNMIQQLKYLLIKIRALEDKDSDKVLIQLSQAEVFVCLADLAAKDYSAIFNQNLSVSMLAIEIFEKLKARVADIHKVKPIREDDYCLILLMALNKLRDIIQQHAQVDNSISQEKEILLNLVIKLLNLELTVSADRPAYLQNNELIYILFLYVASLDIRRDSAGNEVPNPAILLYSISLKEHEDIKIRKEAVKQIEIFDKLDNKTEQINILPTLMQQVVKFFERNQMHIFNARIDSFHEHMEFKQGTQFQNTHYTPVFIEQCLEISRFTIKFLEQEIINKTCSKDEMEEISDQMQRQLLININQNFGTVKSDFTEPLELINKFIKLCSGSQLLVMQQVGSIFILKLLKKSSNMDQSIQALKILKRIIVSMNQGQQETFVKSTNLDEFVEKLVGSEVVASTSSQPGHKQHMKISHETNLQNIMHLTLYSLIASTPEGLRQPIIALFQEKLSAAHAEQEKSLTPNLVDEIKLLIVCLSQVSHLPQLLPVCKVAASLILAALKNKSTLAPLRITLLACLHKILQTQEVAYIKSTSLEVLNIYVPFQSNEKGAQAIDTQVQAGKFFAKGIKNIMKIEGNDNALSDYAQDFLIQFIKCRNKRFEWTLWKPKEDQEMKDEEKKDDQIMQDAEEQGYAVTLNSRRNCVIYLNEVLQLFGKTEVFIQDRFVEIQKVFLKYIFDNKPAIQDISSRALTLIYKTGNAEVKESLVQSLSSTLTGDEKSQQISGETNEDKDEDRELNLGIDSSSTTDQRKKLQTYKDLCRIAVEIGHKEMIYQFLEVHRHHSHYQDIKNAAKGLSNIMMLDERLRTDLMKIAPKILMLTYDYNDEVRDTMRELWATLINVEQESKLIEDKWPEILKEALVQMKQKEFRKRLSASLVLQDLIPNRTWPQLKDNFKELFLGSLILLDDDVESVKKSAVNLTKVIKRQTMKFANIYSNNDIDELKEVLGLVIPMTIDEVIKSNMKAVKFFGVNLLFEIVKSSTQEKMYQSLKIQNKYERQIAFSYNSEEKMKEILNVYLGKITIEVLQNLSQMNAAQEQINQIELYAIDKGMMGGEGASNRISEGDINNLRIKYTRDSEWGEILTICRKKMSQATFDSILNDLINLMIKGHDLTTKSAAVTFIQDIILESKQELITPQNSKKIAQKLTDIYSQNSVSACLSLKESMVQLYASCLGLQFKILHKFPETTQKLVTQVIELPDELESIKTLIIYEIIKNLPAQVLRTGGKDSQMLIKDAIPMIYINKYKTNNQELRAQSERLMRYLKEELTEAGDEDQNSKADNIELNISEQIFMRIHTLFDSNNYDERISAGLAMEDLSIKMQSYELGQSQQVKINIQKMFELISGKYFNNKETLIDSFAKVMSLMENESSWIKDKSFLEKFVSVCLQQIEKFNMSNSRYKNKLIGCLDECFKASAKELSANQVLQIEEVLLKQLNENLESVSQNQNLFDNDKFTSFDEKKDTEKQTLSTIMNCFTALTTLWPHLQNQAGFFKVCRERYSTTNFLVRNSILKVMVAVAKGVGKTDQNRPTFSSDLAGLIDFILAHTAQCGEKYDINLVLLSELCVSSSSADIPAAFSDSIEKNSANLIAILKEKGGDDLLKNVDLIRANLEI